ncbi:MAG: peptide deformylase [Candidatus Shapirobacteria bacterium]|nr:peptide deformylase [Candidatus Shapirobacteria bacterium]MDD5073892.1 peptide deformylase [Candidatus Shapirobacteria bacterium]MDD5481486.1 peptide deformylase [Candidatus Shapirobacteria bacterium]
MEIITAPSPVLTKVSSPITNIDLKTFRLGKQLISSLTDKGVGLAAPQIGKNKTVFIIRLPQQEAQLFINPAITGHSKKKQYSLLLEGANHHQEDYQPQPFLEGCLSLPHLYGTVKRWAKIEACWFNNKGRKVKKTLNGLEAIIFQHELDHLKGLLFPQRVKKEGGQFFQEKNGQLEKISHQEANF